MIDISKEKNRKISTQDVYDVVSLAADAANDNGFLNSFVFSRALWELTAIIINPENKKYSPEFAKSPLKTWDVMLEDGVLDDLLENHKDEIDFVSGVAQEWFEEYGEYLSSLRSVVDDFQTIGGKLNDEALANAKSIITDDDIKDVMDIADKWGMNNVVVSDEEKAKNNNLKLVDKDDNDSLFTDK